MKLFDPISDVVRYIKMYQIYLGFRMYLIYVLYTVNRKESQQNAEDW